MLIKRSFRKLATAKGAKQRKLSSPIVTLVVVAYLVLILAIAYQHQQRVYLIGEQQTRQDLNELADAKVERFEDWLDGNIRDLRYIVALPSIARIASIDSEDDIAPQGDPTLAQWHANLASSFSAYLLAKDNVSQARLIGVANNGLEIVRVNKVEANALPVRKEYLQQKGYRDYFSEILGLREGEIYVSGLNLNREFGKVVYPIEPTLRMGAPVFSPDGSPFGQVVINYTVDDWLSHFRTENFLQDNFQSYLLNSEGAYVIHPNPELEFGFDLNRPRFFEDDFRVVNDTILQVESLGALTDDHDFFYTRRMIPLGSDPENFLSYVLMYPRYHLARSANIAGLKRFVILLSMGVLVALILAYLRSSLVAKQEKLRADMTRRFGKVTQQIVNSSPISIILTNTQGTIELVNDEALRVFGYQRGDLVGQKVEILVPSGQRGAHTSSRNAYSKSPKKRSMGEGLDLKAVTKDGEFFPVEVALNTIDTFDGVKVLAAVNDITSHKNIIDELSTRNAELDEFAYVASHDLKSPLRGIDQLASWLQQDLGEVMDEESSANLKMMRSRISRLETLLSDLLAYARAGNTTDNSELIDVGPWLSEVFDLHCVSRGFKLRLVDPMPKFNSLKTPLEVVFRNLISNSVKHHDQDEGLITISATERKKFVEFRYEDDGPGIPAEHRERAFGVFQTLRPRDEVEGSGMGLAIVRKIVKKFGGTITISDKKEPGVVFIFTWPKL